MIRVSEAVLPGHPDKFCDQVADAIVAEAYRADERAYCQAEVGVWSDQLWISGAVAAGRPLARPIEEIVCEVGRAIGYTDGNAIDVERYRLTNTLCQYVRDPQEWTAHVNDQAVVVGWAGYDEQTAYLPPEHFLADQLERRLFESCRAGLLAGQGPDGKVLVRVRENPEAWAVESLLVTLQHRSEVDVVDLAAWVGRVVGDAYRSLRGADPRWVAEWDEIELLVNPNGPFERGGSDGDNGQTGRKLVFDYYGPRVAIGGGAIFGKDLAHVDRAGAYGARRLAIDQVRNGDARACRVVATYAPNRHEPLDVSLEQEGGKCPDARSLRRRLDQQQIVGELRDEWLQSDDSPPEWVPGGRGLRGF